MDNFFSDIKNSVSGAVKKSGEIVELTKLKLAISDTKGELKSKLYELGEIFYKEQKGIDTDLMETDDLISEIDELKEVLEAQEAKLASLKKQKVCAKCEAAAELDAKFCSKCGAKFEEENDDDEDYVII